MAQIFPFRAARPSAERAASVAVLPYDVVNRTEATALAEGHSESFFRVSRPEVELGAEIDEHDTAVYELGRKNLEWFLQEGILKVDAEAHFYVYRQKMGDHVQTGVVATASVDEYDRGLIKKHELTRADKEDDRMRHIDALSANDEPVFLTYRQRPELDALVESVTTSAPAFDFSSSDDVRHMLWVVSPDVAPKISEGFAAVPCLYIADGHHRSAAASRVAALRKGKPGEHTKFLAVVFPHHEMRVLAYNRVIRDLNGRSAADLLEKVAEKFTLTRSGTGRVSSPHQFGMYLDGHWFTLDAKPGSFPETPMGVLDVAILQNNVLQPIFGISDPRKDPRVDFVGGIRGIRELERRVDSRSARVAFSLFPTRVEQMMDVADANEIMPPKSTWFEPKLRSGLFVHLF